MFKLIAHRGNLYGPNYLFENSVEYIEEAINEGFDVEVDVWKIDSQLYLGHDNPVYFINPMFIINNIDKLWCHAKNKEALEFLINSNTNCFWHDKDDYTITSKGYIWVYPGKKLIPGSIALFDSYSDDDLKNCFGICSDYIDKYK